jgi:hypothetical protein
MKSHHNVIAHIKDTHAALIDSYHYFCEQHWPIFLLNVQKIIEIY